MPAGTRAENFLNVAVKLAGKANAKQIQLVIVEPKDTGLGFGLLPTIKEILHEAAPMSRDKLEKEMVVLQICFLEHMKKIY